MKNLDKQNFIELTKKEFQQYSDSPITDEQAIEIQTNLFNFVNLLIEWDKNEQKETNCEPCSSQDSTRKKSCKISNTQKPERRKTNGQNL